MEARGKMSKLLSSLSFRALVLAAMALSGYSTTIRAQAPPGVPGIPATPAPPAAVVTAAPAAGAAPAAPAQPANLWSFLCPTPEQKAACKAKLCALPITQLFDNMLMPVSLITGGLITGCCPKGPSKAD